MANGVIELTDIKKSYWIADTEYPILKGINAQIKKGEFVALMGPSGSGKSTLLNILGCLDTPTNGHYNLNSKEVSGLDNDQLAEIRNEFIGFIFQNFNLIGTLSAIDNVSLPTFYAGSESIKRATEVLDQVGLSDRKNNKPNELSGGQRQRVAIARALVNNPDLILADEPTGNLDSKTGLEIMKIIVSLNKKQKKTILMVTHDNNVAKMADRIIKLKDGLIVK